MPGVLLVTETVDEPTGDNAVMARICEGLGVRPYRVRGVGGIGNLLKVPILKGFVLDFEGEFGHAPEKVVICADERDLYKDPSASRYLRVNFARVKRSLAGSGIEQLCFLLIRGNLEEFMKRVLPPESQEAYRKAISKHGKKEAARMFAPNVDMGRVKSTAGEVVGTLLCRRCDEP